MTKFSVISGFLGSVKNRYMVYQEDRTLEQKFEMAGNIQGLDGLEICYPGDFEDMDKLKSLVKQYDLGISALNFRSRRTGKWQRGSFSSHLLAERREVVEDLKHLMDIAVDFGVDRITTCPLNEGHDYPFELDYIKAYDFFADSISQAAAYNSDIKISIEYKWNDPRGRCLLGNAGETLAMCESIGHKNVGVTLDFGHSIQASETPAQSAAMLHRAGRLFYVHLNDNDKFWDWDMIPGAYNFWDFIEFFYYLKKLGYDDWFAFDVYPKEIDTVSTFNAAIAYTKKLMAIADGLDDSAVQDILSERNPAKTMTYLMSLI